MGWKRARLGSLLVASALVLGCSAIIQPDVDRLGGGDDGGQHDFDAGRSDAGVPRDDAGPMSDSGLSCATSCDDSVACTVDHCEADRCIHTPNEALCPGGQHCNPVMGCVDAGCTSDASCDDHVFCNGAERCDVGTGACSPGTPPSCADDATCTVDGCDATTDACVHMPSAGACMDAVTCSADTCDPGASTDPSGCVHRAMDALCATGFCSVGGRCDLASGCVGGTARDCSDRDPCTTDACDGAASRCTHAPRDDDGDGYPAASVMGPGGPVACGGTDCDDGDGAIHPGATEACDGDDDDCNGIVDDGCGGTPDDCGSAEPIVLDASGSGSVTGTLTRFADDYQTNAVCMARTGGRDAVYYVDIPSGTWDVTIDTIGSDADTVLAVDFTCGATAFGSVCNDDLDRSAGTESRIWVHRVTAGTFSSTRIYILVDGYNDSSTGAFQLNVHRVAADADRCPSSFGGTPMDISGGGTLVGFQSAYTGAMRGSCQSFADTSPEAVLLVHGPSSGNVRFDVYSTEFSPDVYLRHSPCASGTELACESGAYVGGVYAATVSESVTPGDTYYLVVDGGRTSYAVYYDPR